MSTSSDDGTSGGGGSSDSGASGGSASGATGGFDLRDALEKERARSASFQSAADKANARVDALMGEVREMKGLFQSFDPNQIVRQVQAGITQAQALAKAAEQLRTEFPHARPDVFDGSFATPEELRAAVEQSHQAVETERAAVRTEIEAEFRAEVKAKHGIDLAPPSAPVGDGGKVKLTATDVAAMSWADRAALSDEDLMALSHQGE